jgi:hypothetical protein
VTFQSENSGQLPVVYDLLGREVAVLADEVKAPGMYRVKFDGTALSSGIYFCRLTADST